MPERFSQVDVDGGNLAVWIAGAGEPVLFIHAGIADSRMWDGQIPAFSERYRTIRFDLRGYGQSSTPDQPFSYTSDVLAVMAHAEVERAHIVAASFGGRIALDFALEHPERAKSLTLAGPAVSGAGWEDPQLLAGWEAMESADEEGDPERVIEIETDLWLGGVGRSLGEVPTAVRELVFDMQRGIYQRTWDEDLLQEAAQPAVDRLAEIESPMLVIVGDHERPDIVRNCQQLVASVSEAQLIEIQDAAHLPALEQPDAFNEATLHFLGSFE